MKDAEKEVDKYKATCEVTIPGVAPYCQTIGAVPVSSNPTHEFLKAYAKAYDNIGVEAYHLIHKEPRTHICDAVGESMEHALSIGRRVEKLLETPSRYVEALSKITTSKHNCLLVTYSDTYGVTMYWIMFFLDRAVKACLAVWLDYKKEKMPQEEKIVAYLKTEED